MNNRAFGEHDIRVEHYIEIPSLAKQGWVFLPFIFTAAS